MTREPGRAPPRFCLLYFVPPPFEDSGLPFWVPGVLCQRSEVVLWPPPAGRGALLQAGQHLPQVGGSIPALDQGGAGGGWGERGGPQRGHGRVPQQGDRHLGELQRRWRSLSQRRAPVGGHPPPQLQAGPSCLPHPGLRALPQGNGRTLGRGPGKACVPSARVAPRPRREKLWAEGEASERAEGRPPAGPSEDAGRTPPRGSVQGSTGAGGTGLRLPAPVGPWV